MSDTNITFFHTRHACGHAVYWSDSVLAAQLAVSPCPWCGGERVPPDVLMMRDSKLNAMAFRETKPDGSVPWPDGEPPPDGNVILRHRTDGSCCDEKPL